MKTIVRSGACAAVAMILSVGMAAQTTPQSSSSSAASTITVTGCVQRAPAAGTTTGTSGTAGSASASEPKFVLERAMASPSSSTGTSGATTPTASSYRLSADDAKLTPHVGHKVEISGTLDKAASSASASPSSSSASSTTAPTLKVDTVKMIAASCSE